jgi:predicted RNA-binding protein with PIN domain
MTMTRFVVDGMNVIGAQADGWWRDPDAAVRRLLARLQHAARRSGDEISLVLDGRPLADLPEGMHRGVTVHYARRPGRDAADDRIVELVETDDDAGELRVVTSDRALADRVTESGATTEGAGSFLRRLQRLGA